MIRSLVPTLILVTFLGTTRSIEAFAPSSHAVDPIVIILSDRRRHHHHHRHVSPPRLPPCSDHHHHHHYRDRVAPLLARRPRDRRRGRRRDEDDDYGYDYDDAYDDEYDDLGGTVPGTRQRDGMNIPSAFGRRDGWRLPASVSKALLAGVFVLGVGLGVTVDSAINTNPKDLASRDAVDQAAPNAKLCAEMGASAMAFDQRVFVSFNPFNVFVAQADVKPACVLRPSNVVPVLKDRKLINDKEVFSCKANMNTWAFVGDLDDQPQLSCVYKSEDAQNEFLSNPKFGIGEDYLDDDRASADNGNNLDSAKIKRVKGQLTGGQKDTLLRKQQQQQQLQQQQRVQ